MSTKLSKQDIRAIRLKEQLSELRVWAAEKKYQFDSDKAFLEVRVAMALRTGKRKDSDLVAKLKLELTDMADKHEKKFDKKRDKVLSNINAGLVMATKNKFGEILRDTANEVLAEIEVWEYLYKEAPQDVEDELGKKRGEQDPEEKKAV